MSASRRITVRTDDHGPVTFTDPEWCVRVHVDGGYRDDIAHASEEQHYEVATSIGSAVVATGWGYYPFGSREHATAPYLIVDVDLVLYPETPGQVEEVAAALEEIARHVRTLTPKLAELAEEVGE